MTDNENTQVPLSEPVSEIVPDEPGETEETLFAAQGSQDTEDGRDGLPVYPNREDVPDGLRTRAYFSRHGLHPGPVRAYLCLDEETGSRTPLYLVAESREKSAKKARPRQEKYPGVSKDNNGIYRFEKGMPVPDSLQPRAWFKARNLTVSRLAARRFDPAGNVWVRLYEVSEATPLPNQKAVTEPGSVPQDKPIYDKLTAPRHFRQAGFFSHHQLHRGPHCAYLKEGDVYHKLYDYTRAHVSLKGRYLTWTGKENCERCGITVDGTLLTPKQRICHLCLEELEQERLLQDAIHDLSAINSHPEDYVLLDVEAAGTMSAQHRDHIISISVIDLEGRMLLNTLVYSPLRISWGAQKVHHIRDEMLRGAPAWKDVFRVLKGILGNRKILAYGASSDSAFLRQTNAWYDIPPVSNEFVCLEHLHTRLRGLPTATRLSRAFEAVQDRMEDLMSDGEERHEFRPHRADDDCLMTLVVMRALILDFLREEKPYWKD